MKHLALLIGAVALAGCMQSAPSNDGAISSTNDSLANRLSAGMTPAQVDAIVGPAQTQIRSTTMPDTICKSVIYDEAIDAKYIHLVYVGGVLARASDGHALPCDIA